MTESFAMVAEAQGLPSSGSEITVKLTWLQPPGMTLSRKLIWNTLQ